MKIEVQEKETGLQIIRFEGELDYHCSNDIRERLENVLERKPAKMVVDLSKVPYMDSSGIAAFVEMYQKSKAYGGRIVFCGLQDAVQKVFDLAKLNLFFYLAPSEEEAMKLFSG